MNWILAGFLMFACSVAQYLFIRKSALQKIPSQLINVAMFAIPLIAFVFIALMTRTNLAITGYQFLILVILAVFFSYLGNVFSLKSLEYAPNPGYSLILSKSYVVFTTIASIWIFHSTLTVRSAFAILLIIAFSALITIDTRAQKHEHVRASWLPLSIGAFLCWGMLTITSKYLLILGVNILSRLIYSMAIVTMLIIAEMQWKKTVWKNLPSGHIMTLLWIGILGAGFNYFMQEGFVSAPNIGYINAMNASSIGLVVIGSAFFFHDEFNLRKFIGVVGVIVGLIVLVV